MRLVNGQTAIFLCGVKQTNGLERMHVTVAVACESDSLATSNRCLEEAEGPSP